MRILVGALVLERLAIVLAHQRAAALRIHARVQELLRHAPRIMLQQVNARPRTRRHRTHEGYHALARRGVVQPPLPRALQFARCRLHQARNETLLDQQVPSKTRRRLEVRKRSAREEPRLGIFRRLLALAQHKRKCLIRHIHRHRKRGNTHRRQRMRRVVVIDTATQRPRERCARQRPLRRRRQPQRQRRGRRASKQRGRQHDITRRKRMDFPVGVRGRCRVSGHQKRRILRPEMKQAGRKVGVDHNRQGRTSLL